MVQTFQGLKRSSPALVACQEMRELTAPLVGNPLHEHIKVTVFMDGLRVGPARTQLFRVQASTLEEAIQVTVQEEYSHRQARTPVSAWPGGSTPSANRTAPSGPVPWNSGSPSSRTSAATAAEGWPI
ncbi:hypothetical protein PC129_g14556 [Phytophthora cactorum]|uniref:Uncharacterized protein n=1 Tax=Phytophthora cactorum TaxID=29920 RepID=A0A8T1BT92_9STRA|nr:hypothetical protein Pcac1_g931 [Phytophthora cactorum]KAG2793892.1 hypothetical protein PC111_g22843 [Phytophthora cactorum]KAG2837054.1 hypothetical protein PC112_g5075 [Phytophthora cactorum]KAG2852503.1 hypothetical protein PC113_g14976 [Phytophthora cactorum]KAG2906883.1 hypothetical protein PC115_g14130 [Phytophthora cactorum]